MTDVRRSAHIDLYIDVGAQNISSINKPDSQKAVLKHK